MTREELAGKIRAAKAELPEAGKCHRRDLMKHIRRMENQLRIYDYYRKGADTNCKGQISRVANA